MVALLVLCLPFRKKLQALQNFAEALQKILNALQIFGPPNVFCGSAHGENPCGTFVSRRKMRIFAQSELVDEVGLRLRSKCCGKLVTGLENYRNTHGTNEYEGTV